MYPFLKQQQQEAQQVLLLLPNQQHTNHNISKKLEIFSHHPSNILVHDRRRTS
jgi:hypothetical protein